MGPIIAFKPERLVGRSLTFMRTSVRDGTELGITAFPPCSYRGNVPEALSSASELEHVGPSEALELCLLLTEQPARFERAALRWHGRYCREAKDVTFDDGLAVLALLGAMRGPRASLAASTLADLLSRPGLEPPCEVLVSGCGTCTPGS